MTILKRFIGLGFAGTIQVIYDDNDSDGLSTIQKLAILIPGLDPGNPQPVTIENVKLTFHPFKDGTVSELDEEALICVNGGSETSENLTKTFKVKFYLQLQPFRWTEGKNFLWQRNVVQPVNLTTVESLGKTQFLERAFYTDVKELTPQDWENLKRVPNISQRMLERAEVVVNSVLTNKIHLVPIYGLPTGAYLERKAVLGSNSDILFSLICSIAIAQNTIQIPIGSKPTVIAVMTRFADEENFWSKMQSLFNGVEDSVDIDDLGFLEKKEYYAKKWAWDSQLRSGSRIKFSSSADGTVLQEVINQAQSKNIIITSLSSAPQLLFNYLYSLATLPSIFEGQGTANLLLNLGKPYWQMAKYNVIPYPSLLLAEDYKTGTTQKLADEVMQLQWGTSLFKNESETPEEFKKLAKLIKLSLQPESEISQYYSSLKEFYHQDANDKLLMAMCYLVNNYNLYDEVEDNFGVVVITANNPLEDFYDSLIANNNQGTLNLIPGVLTEGTLKDYLLEITGGHNFEIGSSLDHVEIDFPETKDKITVIGKTKAFTDSDLLFQLEFTLDESKEKINTVTSLKLETIHFPDVLWFSLENTTIKTTIPSNNDRITGNTNFQVNFARKKVDLSIYFPTAKNIVLVTGDFGDNPPGIEDIFQILGGINFVSSFPPPFNVAESLVSKSFKLGYDYESKKVESFNINLETTHPWHLFGKLTLDKLNINVNVVDPTGKRSVSWTASSTFEIKPGQLEVGVSYPNLTVSAIMPESSPSIPIGNFFTFFLSPDVTLELGASVSDFSMWIRPGQASIPTSYIVTVALDTESWNLTLNNITFGITNLGVNVSDDGSGVTGMLSGTTVLFKDDPELELLFSLSASYLGKGNGWLFEGTQGDNPIKVKQILKKYVSSDWAENVPEIDVSGLYFKIQTPGTENNSTSTEGNSGTAKAYEIGGRVKVWDTPLGNNFETLISAKFGYNNKSSILGLREQRFNDADFPIMLTDSNIVVLKIEEQPQKQGAYGEISADIQWNGIKLTVFYNFDPTYKAYGITWGILSGKIRQQNGDDVATLTFTESTTLGSIIETMVGWATGSQFSLGSPWNILDSIPLNNLSLVYNFTKKQVSFNVNIGPIEMGFARIDSINVAYKSNQPNPDDNGVIVELIGQFRWQDNPNKPLGWDASKPEKTPAPEGQGNKYLDLRLLALGQHVTLPCFAEANTVQEAIACMKQLPEPDKDNIMIPPVTLDANSSWLIGMEFGILRFGGDKKANGNGGESGDSAALVSLVQDEAAPSGYFITMQIVFNDPNLYALRIALAGDAAKVLKGLDFQILYKKISDNLGLYKAEIALPDQMRYIRMGQYNITLPVFGIEYYTNGDFQVDFGFPWKADFSRSLTFQTLIWTPIGVPIPVMGSLGVYFGKLSSATTNKVPKIDNGIFNPVLVFGFGIQFGIGYTFEVGILKAGFSLTAVAILEGVIAKFNAYQLTDGSGNIDQVDSSYYFWVQGTVGIIGKLFGSIDFAIIKADVNIDIRILASFTFAPYEPIELNLMASVDIEVSVKINLGLFKIKISFSFSAKISQTITINAIGDNPPWHIVQGETAFFMALRRKRKHNLFEQQMLLAIVADTPLNWRNLKSSESPAMLQGYMTLGLTIAGDSATQLSEQVACYVAMMFIDSVAPAHEDRTGGIAKAYNNSADTSFEILAKMILRWAVAALQPAPVTAQEVDSIVVTDIQLQHLLNALNKSDEPTPIPSADIENFMAGQFNFQVEGPTTSKEPNATYFPVPPSMKLSLPKYGSDYNALSYTFGEYNKTSSGYLAYLRDYFNQLAVKVQEETNNSIRLFALNDSDGESLGSFIFSDYFLMICRQMLQSALDSLREFKYFLQDGNTPNDIIQWINTNADLSGSSAYNLEELFTDNAGVALNSGSSLVIQGVTYVVQTNDTLDSIAANSLFSGGFTGAALATLNADTDNTLSAGIVINYPGKPPYTTQPGQSLKSVAEAIGGIDVADLIQNGSITSLPNLPLPVATYKIPDFTYKTVAGDTLRSIAAKFRIDQKQLAAPSANGQVVNLFNSSTNPTLDIANLTQFKVGELLKEIQASQGLQHLSGMVSRYYLTGLRLPTKGIAPGKKGMWVTGDSPDNYKLPDFAGLYALTGQQFPIPNLNSTDDFNVNFENGGLAWLNFVNEEPTTLQISIKPNTNDTAQINLVKRFATTTRLDTELIYLGLGGMFNTKKATYTFNTEIAWNAASSFNVPYGGKPPGIPTMQLWRLPDPLVDLPDLATRKVNPRMAIKVGEYSEAARAMVERDLNYYGYATLIEFTVKKVPTLEASPSTKTTYEVIGADGSSAKILERIVSQIGNNNEVIQTLILAYATDPNGTTPQGIQTDNANSLTLGLAQVNLSTETRPDSGFSAELLLTESGAEGMTLLNQKTDFIRLLWEASITRAGGYFLYYFNQDSRGGLPDRVFNDKQEAQLSLIVVYSQPTYTTLQNTIGNYMNALVTGEAIDRNNTVLFAESNPNPNITIPSTATQTLAEIAYGYFGNISQLAADNADLALRGGRELVVSEGTYVVGLDAPGGDLQTIATYFGTTQQAIKDANPKLTTWPNTLAQYTALHLPVLTLQVGIHQGGNTLDHLAKYYGTNLTTLANHNKDVAGIFADGQAVKISGGPVITTSTVPAGNVTVEAIRPLPPALPDTPTGDNYGEIFLLNLYSLLSYQVAGNLYFTASQLGLPASPTAEPEDSGNISKIRVPRILAERDDWLFHLAVPYNQFSQQTSDAASDLPDPNNSPYKGLGDLLQVDFAWQDLYGNRLITTLSNPAANDKAPLNQSPILTGYNDAIISLKQWPSVAATYEVVDDSGSPTLNLFLTFDNSVYQGLISAEVKSATTIHAVFTEALDQNSAGTTANYTLDNGITIQSVGLSTDNRTVILTVDLLPTEVEIALSVANISNADKTQTFQGVAKFYNPETVGEPTSTLLQKAKGDLQTLTQLWYQLTDSYGIRYSVTTSLVEDEYILDSTQVSDLVQTWLASIWRFVNDRAHGDTTVPVPATSHLLSFPIDEANLNQKEIYKLNLSFTIERTGGAVMGNLETTGGIKSVSTDITPYAGTADETVSSLRTFAQNFEKALEKTGVYTLKIATGIDREESLSGKGGNELWVVRLGIDQQTSIAYQINDDEPLLCAPRPVSTKLENRDQIPIWDFNPQSGIDFSARPSRYLNFTNIDMDLWTQQLFNTIDDTLSPEFTAAIQLVDHHQNKTYLQTMLDNKKALAKIIKDWMIFVFEGESGSTTAISEVFYQQLLVRLSNAYTIKAGVQYSAKVEAGEFKLFFISLAPNDNNNLILLFTSDIPQTTAENPDNYSISGELTVSSAKLDAQNPQLVTLNLSGTPVVGETQVTIAEDYKDIRNTTIAPESRKMFVQPGSAATPEIYGNITQTFKFLGVAIDETNKAHLYLYFSGMLYRGTGQEPNSALNVNNYAVSGLTINTVSLDADNFVVRLTLSDGAIVNQTTVTVVNLTTITGQVLLPPLVQTVTKEVDVSHRAQNITINSAKLNLKNSDRVPLPFLVSAPQLVRSDAGEVLSYIELDTTYAGNEIEHQIGTLPNISDYRASTWLSFINGASLLNTKLGATKVPMILRSFPASPAMVNQQGEASNSRSDNDISKILEWNYTINYSQAFHYPQDELNFTVNFNVHHDTTVLATFEDAFNPLAEFITVYPEVEKVFLDKLVKIDATTSDPDEFRTAAIALDAFNTLVSRIIASAEGNGLQVSDFSPSHLTLAVEPYNFRLKEGSGTVGAETAVLVITIIGKPPAGIGTPTVKIPNYTTKSYTGTCNGDFCFYFEDAGGNPLKALTGQGIVPRAVVLPKMNILARQDAETTVELKRNVDLVPGKTTASDFIYTTGKVGFANLYHPLIEYDREIPIAAICGGAPRNAMLSQHLANLFNKLLMKNSQDTLSFLMTNTYTYQSNPALDGIELPVIMQPMQIFNMKASSGSNHNKTLTEMIENWSKSIQKWFRDHQTSTQGGILYFDLTIFSNLTQQPMPLLRLNSLSLELEYITDIPKVLSS